MVSWWSSGYDACPDSKRPGFDPHWGTNVLIHHDTISIEITLGYGVNDSWPVKFYGHGFSVGTRGRELLQHLQGVGVVDHHALYRY